MVAILYLNLSCFCLFPVCYNFLEKCHYFVFCANFDIRNNSIIVLIAYFVDIILRYYVHRVSKNVPPLACYNFDAHEWILIFFGRNVTDKVGNQKTLYYATSDNVCYCTIWQNAKQHKNHMFHSVGLCYTHNAGLCAVFLKEKVVICDVFDSV